MNKTKKKIILSAIELYNENGLVNVLNQEIANKLFLSLPTIKSHLARVYSKLDVNSRTLAMAKLRELT